MRLVAIIFLAIIGCNNAETTKSATSENTISNIERKDTVTTKTDFTKDSIFTIHFPKDSNSFTITGKLNGIGKPVTAIIPVKKGNQLTVVLVAEDSVANIRINQIFTPDGKADGPFGKSLKRKITEQGDYKIIIGEDQMQGEEWKGKFRLTVKVE